MNDKLHYVGLRTYQNADTYIQEALVLGCNRALPKQCIKTLSWGEIIYLGIFQPVAKPKPAQLPPTVPTVSTLFGNIAVAVPPQTKQKKFDRTGLAKIFGAVRVDGINYTSDRNPEQVNYELEHRLKMQKPEHVDVQKVTRRCGEYMLKIIGTTQASLKQICETLEQIEKDIDVKVKCFVTGTFVALDTVEQLPNVKFTQGLLHLPDHYTPPLREVLKKLCKAKDSIELGNITGYKQKKYYTKKELGVKP